ncbi:putative mycofactocin system creatinine amidohydrolase family protein MftE [Tepidimonas fonticaldi]|uniref:Putative mycofactocin system creatinine amidohydrolase family protein MftE n=2 Tax=Tepidimonas fonticaldi TaxID=1101373 RepID=A0A554XMS3_9BURK|nr:putative mycofactocin system creatinine amidohydrolase family protein MftE [Tepidimonas fonticaldi]
MAEQQVVPWADKMQGMSPPPAADSAPRLKRWADLRWPEFAALDLAHTVAVLPVGATEQHGPHLPLDVDTAIVEAVLAAAAGHLPAEAPVYVLPTLPVGLSPEHERFPGTLTLSAETALALWRDLGASVARAGVRKLVIFNGHGGHIGLMDLAGRELRARHDLLVWGVNWFHLPLIEPDGHDLEADLDARERRFGVHAGQIETAVMLAIGPERVAQDALRDFPSASEERARRYALLGDGRSAKFAWQMQDVHPAGAAGHAAAADAGWGRRAVAAAGRSLAQLLQDVVAVPLSTAVPGPSLA